jgi:hypothetical protein
VNLDLSFFEFSVILILVGVLFGLDRISRNLVEIIKVLEKDRS